MNIKRLFYIFIPILYLGTYGWCWAAGTSQSADQTAFYDLPRPLSVRIGPPSAHYQKHGYAGFKDEHAEREPFIYSIAKDGILHAIEADTQAEIFTFAAAVTPPSQQPSAEYVRPYYIGGAITVADAYFKKADEATADWHTILVGTTGAAGQSIFALDITNPADTAHKVNDPLWQISPKTHNEFAQLGYTIGRPAVVQTNDDQWVVVFGNGYGSSSGQSILYIVDIANGDLLNKIQLGEGANNGLSTPVVVDTNGDYRADRIYAGDLHGNLWAIDASSSNPNDWHNAYGSDPLFTTDDSQPITIRPTVVLHPRGGQMVLFGTGGCYPASADTNAWQTTQSFYGIWDSASTAQPTEISEDHLTKRTINEITSESGAIIRTVSGKRVDWTLAPDDGSSIMGWYMKLNANQGERVVLNPTIRGSRLLITTIINPNPSCRDNDGISGWLMQLDPISGLPLKHARFDINGDQIINREDNVIPDNSDSDAGNDTPVPVSGKHFENVDTPPQSFVITDADSDVRYKVVLTSDGTTEKIKIGMPSYNLGRQSWHQLK